MPSPWKLGNNVGSNLKVHCNKLSVMILVLQLKSVPYFDRGTLAVTSVRQSGPEFTKVMVVLYNSHTPSVFKYLWAFYFVLKHRYSYWGKTNYYKLRTSRTPQKSILKNQFPSCGVEWLLNLMSEWTITYRYTEIYEMNSWHFPSISTLFSSKGIFTYSYFPYPPKHTHTDTQPHTQTPTHTHIDN